MGRSRLLIECGFLALTLFAVAAIFGANGILRSLMAVLLVFVLPGRTLLAAWFPRRLAEAPGNILLTIILSIALTVMGGLLLNLLPSGLEAQTWALWLGGITLVNGVIALLRTARPSDQPVPIATPALRPGQALMIALASLMLVGAISLARGGVLSQPRPGFTQLWILPAAEPEGIQVGVQNEEGMPLTYWLVIRQGETPVQAYYDVEVETGGTWNITVPLSPDMWSVGQPIDAQLYRADQPDNVYRSVTLWLTETDSR
jgi:uncharacterized membrane protein